MELRHLRYFVAVADELNFTRAAARLRLAQPSLTRQIRDLEDEVEVQLFHRAKNRITLTESGRSFLMDARRLLSDCDSCLAALQTRAHGERGPLRIGYMASVFHRLLPLTLATFHKNCPKTELQLFDMTPVEQRKALEERTIDLALAGSRLHSDVAELTSTGVGSHEMCAVLPAGEPLARNASIDLVDLAPLKFICTAPHTHPGAREWLVAVCGEAGFAPRIVQEAERESAVVHLVASGMGVALLPETSQLLAHERIVFRGLRRRLTTALSAVWRRDNESAPLRDYVQIVIATAADPGGAVSSLVFSHIVA